MDDVSYLRCDMWRATLKDGWLEVQVLSQKLGLTPWQAESCSTIDEVDVEVDWQCLEGFQKVDENPGS